MFSRTPRRLAATSIALAAAMAAVSLGLAAPAGEAASTNAHHHSGTLQGPSPTASPTPTPTATATATSTSTATPTATPTATASPTPTPSPSATASPTAAPSPTASSSSSPYVTACGTGFCLNGSPFPIFGASHPTWQSNVATTMSLVPQAHVRVLRITNFLNESGNTSTDPYDASRWALVDSYVAAAAQNNLHVLLDLSTYRNLLWNACKGPGYDWNSFLTWVAHRTNTVNGRTYSADPTIAMVALAGEMDPPGTYTKASGCSFSYSSADVTNFYSRTLSELRAAMPNQLATTGGFLHLDYNAGIDWKTIMSNPADQVCALHVYSSGDATVSVPNVASLCQSLNKPWMIEEFGFPQSDGDATRAQEYAGRFQTALAYKAAGVLFWNLGPESSGGSYDVNGTTPQTLTVVQNNAPK